MKTLFLIRHAKSSWADPALPDKDRPLGDRGRRDARKMGKD
jgi:phosphohistidine phosphatase